MDENKTIHKYEYQCKALLELCNEKFIECTFVDCDLVGCNCVFEGCSFVRGKQSINLATYVNCHFGTIK